MGTASVATVAGLGAAQAAEPATGAAADSASGTPPTFLPSYAGSGFLATLKTSPPPPAATPPPAGAEFRSTLAIGTVSEPAPTPPPAAPTPPAAQAAAPTAAPAQAAPAVTTAAAPADAAKPQAAPKERQPGVISKVRDRIQQHIAKAKAGNHLRTVGDPQPANLHAAKAAPAAAPSAATSSSVAATASNTPPAWPKLLPQQAGASGSRWSDADVTVARARCVQLLKQIDAVTIPEQSIRDGECGAPAPIRVVSVGRKPEVAISPPALMTCDMAVALHDWVRKDVQPAARKLMGTEIIKIEAMSDYSCRNAYGRARTRLSEHGRANALDIRGFVTAKGDNAFVLEDWGRTTREIAWYQQQQRAVAQQHKAAPAPAVPAGTAAHPANGIAAAGTAAGVIARQTIVDGISRARGVVPGASADAAASQPPAVTFDMARLGGPKPQDVAKSLEGKMVPLNGKHAAPPLPTLASLPADAIPAGKDARKAVFLRHAHASACRVFGTVLGPEANNAHRNHLHVDLAERATGAFCE